MTQIQLQFLAGPAAGKRAAFANPPVTFGRDAENTVVVSGKFVSRQHGELRVDDGQWVLVNASPNGTEVAGKSAKKPLRLQEGDVISIGGQPMFQVVAAAVAPEIVINPEDQPLTATAAAAGPTRKPVNRKTKLWIGIGVYLLAMLVLMVVLRSLTSDESEGIKPAEKLSTDQIEREITKPLPPVILDPRQAEQSLREARELFNQLHASSDAPYHAYRSYQEAMRYAGKETLDEGLDQRRYRDVQLMLIENVLREYESAYNTLVAGRFEEADKAFHHVTRIYPDDRSRIYANAQEQRGIAKKYMKMKRGRR